MPKFADDPLHSTAREKHSLFQPKSLLDTFLVRVAFGEQELAEQLFTNEYEGDVLKIQIALSYQGIFTDYSGRTFHCSAYEYAYWAKDTHMCRMLERYMNEATKATMLGRIDAIEGIFLEAGQPVGLKYQQNGAEHRSAHFDLSPLITALEQYVHRGNHSVAMQPACMRVGMAQLDVPAHIAQEYCHPTRSFVPLPSFNVDREDISKETLPRVLVTEHRLLSRDSLWFQLGQDESGFDFGFAFMRSKYSKPMRVQGALDAGEENDLAAIIRLDKVRSADLELSRTHLLPSDSPSMSM